MFKKLSLLVIFLYLVPLAGQGFFSIVDDVSAPLVGTQLGVRQEAHSPGVYLVTYAADGNEVFFRNQQALAYSALNKGIDFILNYHRSQLDAVFAEKYAKILEQKKGAGYWLWKPWVILKTLESVPENAIIFYVDSGFVFRNPVQSLIELAQKHDMVFIAYDEQEFGYLGQKTKHEALSRLDCDTLVCRQAPIIWAGFMVLRNTPPTRLFIKKWLDYCCDETILTDMPSSKPEYPEYLNHQHDQSLLGVLVHLNPQGQSLLPEKDLRHYAVWHHRHPDRASDSLLPYMQPRGFFRKVQKGLLNNPPMLWLRKYLKEEA
ncbi:MAG: hypothetical protein WCG04_03165 [Alphaproteobacteria bacterium]